MIVMLIAMLIVMLIVSFIIILIVLLFVMLILIIISCPRKGGAGVRLVSRPLLRMAMLRMII